MDDERGDATEEVEMTEAGRFLVCFFSLGATWQQVPLLLLLFNHC